MPNDVTPRAQAVAMDPVAALKIAAAAFREYETHHAEKFVRELHRGKECIEAERKSARNRELAEMCEAAADAASAGAGSADTAMRELAESVDQLEVYTQLALAGTDRMKRENAHLRVVAQKVGCPYGHIRSADRGCELGYPGCACMDDLLALQVWCPEDEEKAAVRLGKRVAMLESVNADLRAQIDNMLRDDGK